MDQKGTALPLTEVSDSSLAFNEYRYLFRQAFQKAAIAVTALFDKMKSNRTETFSD